MTHLPCSHCVLPDLKNTSRRTLHSHFVCTFPCVSISKNLCHIQEAVEGRANAKFRGDLEAEDVHQRLPVLIPVVLVMHESPVKPVN